MEPTRHHHEDEPNLHHSGEIPIVQPDFDSVKLPSVKSPVQQPVVLDTKIRAKKTIEAFCESVPSTIFMTVITFWALYQSDIRLAATHKDADYGFMVVISIIFFVFLIEILLQCYYKDDYINIPNWAPLPDETYLETWIRRMQFGGFYFWLDSIATLSLIFDVSKYSIFMSYST